MLLSEAELDPYFDMATRDIFRFEGHAMYTVDVEQPRFRAYLAGEAYDPAAEPRVWYDYIRDRVDEGVTWRKVRVFHAPLGDYERWECEWSYTATERHGQRTFILDTAGGAVLPELPDYDWWMFDNSTVLRMHYDSAGAFVGAEPLAARETPRHVRFRDTALAAAAPFPAWWSAHAEHWRENWLPTAS